MAKKNLSPFDLVKQAGEQKNKDLFAPSSNMARKIQPVSQRKLNAPSGNVSGSVATNKPNLKGSVQAGVNNENAPMLSPVQQAGAYGQADPGHTAWETGTSTTSPNEGPCYGVNILGQQFEVSCDASNCVFGPCGSTTTTTPGTGDFYTGPGTSTSDDDTGGDDGGDDCQPEYNILGQCIACCDGVGGGGDDGGGYDNDTGLCVMICSDGCQQEVPCGDMSSGTYFTGAECCDGSGGFDEGDDCEPSYNILGQCISCCDGGSSGDDSGDDSGYDGSSYVVCPDGTFAPGMEYCDDPEGEGCQPSYNLLGQCIACCDGWQDPDDDDSGDDDSGNEGGDAGPCIYICSDGCSYQADCNGNAAGNYFTGQDCCESGEPDEEDECTPNYNILGQCVSCCD